MKRTADLMGALAGRAFALAVLPVMLAVLLAVPAPVAGGTGSEWKECIDDSLLDYNDCLMESSGWFNRKLCDIAFQIDAVVCSAAVVGEVKELLQI